eukprot:TRINITY_DN6488_c0_g1_i1.p1 TRINITY_DN6488_c0_g1~~TRINITY_DN6488_c0_g1_i1.p1  ORF type:complete len:365 (+),score=70.97 TRINITY_DN6488_c0_g1_i1:62-1156(+)
MHRTTVNRLPAAAFSKKFEKKLNSIKMSGLRDTTRDPLLTTGGSQLLPTTGTGIKVGEHDLLGQALLIHGLGNLNTNDMDDDNRKPKKSPDDGSFEKVVEDLQRIRKTYGLATHARTFDSSLSQGVDAILTTMREASKHKNETSHSPPVLKRRRIRSHEHQPHYSVISQATTVTSMFDTVAQNVENDAPREQSAKFREILKICKGNHGVAPRPSFRRRPPSLKQLTASETIEYALAEKKPAPQTPPKEKIKKKPTVSPLAEFSDIDPGILKAPPMAVDSDWVDSLTAKEKEPPATIQKSDRMVSFSKDEAEDTLEDTVQWMKAAAETDVAKIKSLGKELSKPKAAVPESAAKWMGAFLEKAKLS